MSNDVKLRSPKPTVPSNVYTALIAVAFAAILAAALFITYKHYSFYGTIFSVPFVR